MCCEEEWSSSSHPPFQGCQISTTFLTTLNEDPCGAALSSDAVIEAELSALLLPASQAQTEAQCPLVCHVCPQLLLLLFLPLSTVPCTQESRQVLRSWTVTVRFSEMTQPAQCSTFYTAFVHILHSHFTSALDAFRTEARAEPASVVTCLLSSDATSADSVITHFLWLWQFPSPVTRGCHFIRYV